MALIVAIAAAVLVLTQGIGRPTAATPPPAPQPQPTWTTYVDQMPTECYALVDRAVDLYLRSLESDKATLDAARKSVRQDYAAAAKSIKKAEKMLPGLTKSRDAFLTQARKCEAK
jgi:hypothetical protein